MSPICYTDQICNYYSNISEYPIVGTIARNRYYISCHLPTGAKQLFDREEVAPNSKLSTCRTEIFFTKPSMIFNLCRIQR